MEFDSTFQKQLGMSSSQLTFTPSFFRGVGIPPSRLLTIINHIIAIYQPLLTRYITLTNGRAEPPTMCRSFLSNGATTVGLPHPEAAYMLFTFGSLIEPWFKTRGWHSADHSESVRQQRKQWMIEVINNVYHVRHNMLIVEMQHVYIIIIYIYIYIYIYTYIYMHYIISTIYGICTHPVHVAKQMIGPHKSTS